MKVKIKDIKADPKKRIRIVSGNDITDLKESVEKLGLIHPIVLDEDLSLIAGYRRLQCAKDLGWDIIDAEIREGLSELERYDIELEENWKRKNLNPYEMAVGLSKRKEIYEKLHPETKHGGDRKSEEFKEKEKIQVTDSVTRKRFTKATAEKLGIAETVVKEYVKMGDAIRQDKITPEIKEKFKRREIAKSKVLSDIRIDRLAAKKTPRKPPRKLFIIPEEPPAKFCYKCEHSVVGVCPMCLERVLICNVGGIFSIKDYMKFACEKYED